MCVGARKYYMEKMRHTDSIYLSAKWKNAFQVEIISECWKTAKYFYGCLCQPVKFSLPRPLPQQNSENPLLHPFTLTSHLLDFPLHSLGSLPNPFYP